MSSLLFDRKAALLTLLDSGGVVVGAPFVAYNNVDSSSKGPWPAGTYHYVDHVLHSDMSDPEMAYGLYGILVFLVPGRTGMGVHSGRHDIPDGLGRIGPAHATMGCIRTTDDAMLAILTHMKSDAMTAITVQDNGAAGARLDAMLAVRGKRAASKARRARKRRK